MHYILLLRAGNMTHKLFIVGVGPGDANLITVRAVRVLQSVRHVFVPVSQEGRDSLAYEIARQHIHDDATVTRLLFPMVRERAVMETHYRENFSIIESTVGRGEPAALLTIGDPSTYSTAWQVLKRMQQCRPDIEVETVPGITSFAAGAASAGVALAEGNETVSVVSSYDCVERLEAIIDAADTVVFLKTYTTRRRLLDIIRKKGLIDHCIYIQRCGTDDEKIYYDMEHIPQDPEYLSMIILKKKSATIA